MTKKFDLTVTKHISVTAQDIDDIMVSALEGGINYWCIEAEVVGPYLGEYASEQISRGGELILHDVEGEKNTLTLAKFLTGLQNWAAGDYQHYGALKDGKVDTCEIDALCADTIVQLVLFGEVVYA